MDRRQAAGATRVHAGLWVGPTPPCGARVAGLSAIVLCAIEIQPADACFAGVAVVRCPLDDSHVPTSRQEKRLAASTAVKVAELLRQGKTVLCACAQGRNRSGLVAALALQELGWSADQAIAAVKQARDMPGRPALCRPEFLEFLYVRDMQPAGQPDRPFVYGPGHPDFGLFGIGA